MAEVWVKSLDGFTLFKAKSITAVRLGRGVKVATLEVKFEGEFHTVAAESAASEVTGGVQEKTIREVAGPLRSQFFDRLTQLELNESAPHAFLSFEKGSWLSEIVGHEQVTV